MHSPSRPPMLSSQRSPTMIILSALGPATSLPGCLCGWTKFLGVGVGFYLLSRLASLLSLKHKPIRTLSPLHASSRWSGSLPLPQEDLHCTWASDSCHCSCLSDTRGEGRGVGSPFASPLFLVRLWSTTTFFCWQICFQMGFWEPSRSHS